jgi:peptidyl-prolyl cis-trans isomerase SurA
MRVHADIDSGRGEVVASSLRDSAGRMQAFPTLKRGANILLRLRRIDQNLSLLLLIFALPGWGIAAQGQEPAPAAQVQTLDRVVAAVNNQPILWSDVTNEIRFAVLDPEDVNGTLTPQRALQQLISRALIQQQIRQEDATAALPDDEEVQERVNEIRKELPVCVRVNCSTDAGWQAFLRTNGLTAEQVENYLRLRLEILRFIEIRFRQGIRISPEETEAYYRDKLLPQYAKGAQVPPLNAVGARIEEILLEQQVNSMFDNWLDNLRKQGNVEVLDASLESGSQVPSGSDRVE